MTSTATTTPSSMALLAAGGVIGATAVLIVLYFHPTSASTEEVNRLRQQLEKEKEARQVERQARISLQQASRRALVSSQLSQGFTFKAIGHIESPFADRRGTPRQPSLVPAAIGRIVFDKKLVQHEHYAELELFSHVWIIFVFHDNTNAASETEDSTSNDGKAHTATAKIRPPRLYGQKVGCLSTRSPHRPNNIGLSVCEIVSVSKDGITLRGVDFVSGTPILDIKPYIPYDIVPSVLPLPMAVYPPFLGAGSQGLEGGANATTLRVPAWIYESDILVRPVSFSTAAAAQLEALFDARSEAKRNKETVGRFCADAAHARALISQVLRQDVRGVRQGRGSSSSAGNSARGNSSSSCGNGIGIGAASTLRGGCARDQPTEPGNNCEEATTASRAPSLKEEQGEPGLQESYFVRLDGLRVAFATQEADIVVVSVVPYIP